jgi:hypothetical protein
MRGALGFLALQATKGRAAAWLDQEPLKCRSLALMQGFSAPKERFYAPMQLVAPSAVTIAVATDAMICIMNLNVSFLVMVL